ncbi:nitrite reductase (NADH) large subunit [Paenibacillus cellulosilyticus]|uniref:Nitrite reductase (NADH) large subunit n=1 Tax=Paenibacillus cellulosilyticus TaxID=375489 RepID=A0A2V2YQA3_9BACL|nr:nitrite reductase large subunit NirB [Paenibacillus cellulosilyticus]PWV98606.1 nitrite reductase (NADH) large subunit [Paenibacillus cellulosilyticus]QKS43874.1 NAD(P)/FAD-dependent oxidoreductase [Paenibacillus cellulosilyticus]
MTRQKLVLIGNGMAGVRCIEEILKLRPDAFDITIIGAEPHPNYNRIMLSKVLQGDTPMSAITINEYVWYEERGITLYTGEAVIAIDTKGRTVTTDRKRVIAYDKLIIATGSLPFMLPLPGNDKPGVTAFRNMKDCELMVETAANHKRAAVIGGGLLGLEAARGLLNLGMEDVHVIHNSRYLMNRQLDPHSANMLKQELEQQGMKIWLERNTERIIGRKRVEALQFTDGTRLAVDLVVIAVGIKPNVRLAAESGIEVSRAIVVNDRMETSVPNVYAVGECAEHRGMVYGLVAPLYEQGKVLAQAICEQETEGYHGSVLYSQLKVSGVDVFSVGDIDDSQLSTMQLQYDGIRRTYRKIGIRDNRIVGAVLFGDSSDSNKLLSYVKQGADVSVLEQEASASGGGAGGGTTEYVSELSDSETICSCNGVSKGTITTAIREQALETFEQVRECTRAASSCGGCKPLVSALLQCVLESSEDEAVKVTPLCGCTTLSREQLKDAIAASRTSTTREAMATLGWQTADGCKVCRPAIRYYIGSLGRLSASDRTPVSSAALTAAAETEVEMTASAATGKGSYALLANGTFAVQPRLYGGVTTAEQLRRIADAIERYHVPLAKLNGDGRLELLGLSEAEAVGVAQSLGSPVAAYAYGRPVASVVTCGGISYERGAVRDSIATGAMLERRLERLQLPTTVSAAVSASPLHRAGSLVRDIGIVGVPGGWELYAGGSAGIEVKEAKLLLTEPDERAVVDAAAAVLQLYAEEALYGEPVWQWLERSGAVAIRERVLDPRSRRTLLLRSQYEAEQPMALRGECS